MSSHFCLTLIEFDSRNRIFEKMLFPNVQGSIEDSPDASYAIHTFHPTDPKVVRTILLCNIPPVLKIMLAGLVTFSRGTFINLRDSTKNDHPIRPRPRS